MKKLILLMIAACTFAACENKNNGGGVEAPKRLITSVVQVDDKGAEMKSYTMTYDDKGKMTECNIVEDGVPYLTSKITHSDTKVTIDYTEQYVSEFSGTKYVETGTIVANLNAQKYAETINHKYNAKYGDEPAESREILETMTYNANGEVISASEKFILPADDNDVDNYKFTWSDGNMTKFEWIDSETNTLKYNTQANNLTNLDINWFLSSSEGIAFIFAARGDAPFLSSMGYCGKRSANHITEQSVVYGSGTPNVYECEYTFDAESYPTQIKLYGYKDGVKTLSGTVKISYNK